MSHGPKENQPTGKISENKKPFKQREERHTAELMMADKKLAFQNNEKQALESRVNKECIFQNMESEEREALIIASNAISILNEEKEKQALQLKSANAQIAILKEEKKKFVEESVISLDELKNTNANMLKINEGLLQKVMERTAQLEDANKELESFSYSVSHDLKAPLRVVQGYIGMLKERYGHQFDSGATRLMNIIVAKAKKMAHLIDSLLVFAHYGVKDLTRRSISMNDMVKDVWAQLMRECNMTVAPQFNIAALASVYADKVTIKQVWINLISNAIKYSSLKDKAIIEIGSVIKEDEIIYYVKDNGVGFDMKYAGKLFGVFQRMHTDEKFEGNGVGLAIVYRIISKHKGRVWAEAGVNEGATFYFSLPVTAV